MKQTDQELWAVAAEFFKLKSEGKNPTAQYYEPNDNTWHDYNDSGVPDTPNFDDGDIWRLKPETIQHKGGEYPKPCTDVDELLKAGVVFSPSFLITNRGESSESYSSSDDTASYSKDQRIAMANSGLYYLKREDAIARAKVIYEID